MKDFTGQKVGANYFRGAEAVGGWIYFDETGFTFQSHSFNIQTGATRIEYNIIQRIEKGKSMGLIPNRMTVFTKGGVAHQFVINHRNDVVEFLEDKIR